MHRLVPIVALAAVAVAGTVQPSASSVHFCVQLVRATDSTEPPQAGSRPVDPKLAKTFRAALRWKHYWEISQRRLDLSPGRTANVRLSQERAVEIDLTRPGKRIATSFQNGKPVDRMTVPTGEGFTLMGGDRDRSSAWFIVVRRDHPGE